MLTRTDTEYAPWNIVEAVDRRFATAKIYAIVVQTLAEKVEEVKKRKKKEETKGEEDKTKVWTGVEKESILGKADLSFTYSKEEYKKRLEKLQKKMEKLHGELYRRRIPVVLGFEGWDAGGKARLSGLQRRWIPGGMWFTLPRRQMILRKRIIISGASGRICRKRDM